MADTIERIYKLVVDGGQAARDLNAIAKSAADADKRFADAMNSVKKLGAALAAGFTVGSVVASIKNNIDAMDELSKSVQKVGIAAEDLQKLRYAADLSGLSAEDLDKSIGKLAVTMTDLETGTSDAHKALKAIGVQSGDSPVQALDKIAEEFAKMPDGIDKTAMAIKIFGKAGADLIPLLNGGAKGLKELTDEAERYGVVLSGSTLKAAEQFNDNLSRLEGVTSSVMKQITVGLLPALQTLTQFLVDKANVGDGFVTTGERMGDMLVNLGKFALFAAAQLQVYGIIVGATAAAVASPSNTITIFDMAKADIRALREGMEQDFAKIDELQKKFKDSAKAGTPADAAGGGTASAAIKAAEALEAAAKKQREADAAAAKAQAERTKALEKHRKIEDAAWKVQIENARIEEDAQKRSDEALKAKNETLDANARAIMEVDRAAKEHLDSIEQEGARLQYLVDLTDESSDAYRNSTDAQKAYARAQLAIADTSNTSTQTLVKQQTELDILNDGFEDFFKNMAQGTADVEDLFKRMIQSVIAQLLKLWAKKYIIDTLASFFGITPTAAPGGTPAVQTAGVQPFTSGGVMSAPLVPLTMATAAGSTAPLSASGSRSMGTQAQQPMKVTVNNYSGSTVTTRQRAPNDIEVIVSEVKASLTADVLRGGNDFAHASERAWGLSRGSAAAF